MNNKEGKQFVFISLVFILLFLSCNKKETGLPQFHLQVATDSLNFGGYIPGEIAYYDRTGRIQFDDETAKIKYRGNASRLYEKKCFSIKFSEDKCFDGFPCHDTWKLNAEYIDKTFMRNKLSYDLFRQFSPYNYAPHIIYAIVYLNDDYRGIYALTERIDKDRLTLIKKDTNAVLFKDTPVFYPPEEHDERYINYVKFYKWDPRFNCFPPDEFKELLATAYFNQKYPDIYKMDKRQEIYYISDFIFNSSDEDFTNESIFCKYFIIENVMDWHLLILVTNSQDGLYKNYYLYRKGTGEPFMFTPWDYDHSFGRDGDGEPNPDRIVNERRIRLFDRLLETDAFNYKRRLYDRFMALKEKNILTTSHLYEMIDENAEILKPYIGENEAKWPPDSNHYFIGCTFESEVNLMKDWIEKRMVDVEEYLKNLSTNCTN
ncbi:MAG: CotH kinase family protein [Bacteroidales bacterium]|nr:CotH kinase family protein [Bacteroidales bacterium]